LTRILVRSRIGIRARTDLTHVERRKMVTAVGILVLVLGMIAWVGQSLAFLAPSLAVSLGVLEPENEVDPTLHIIEARAEGLADILLAWTLPTSALLMILGHPLWPYLALFGAGVFLYFSALITFSRIFLRGAGRKVGRPASERAAFLFGGLWAACSIAMVVLAANHLTA
jgi:hypothetical protein